MPEFNNLLLPRPSIERSLLITERTSLLAPDCLIKLFACWVILLNASNAPSLTFTEASPLK